MGNSRARPISFKLDLPLCFHRCESPFYNVVQIALPAVVGNIYRRPTLAPTSCSTSRQTHEKKASSFILKQISSRFTLLSCLFSPPHTIFPPFISRSFKHILCLPFHALHSPSPSPIFCSLPPVFLSRAILLYALTPAGWLLLNGSSTECNCFVNNSTGTKVRDRAAL